MLVLLCCATSYKPLGVLGCGVGEWKRVGHCHCRAAVGDGFWSVDGRKKKVISGFCERSAAAEAVQQQPQRRRLTNRC